eukprot:gene6712-7805_t
MRFAILAIALLFTTAAFAASEKYTFTGTFDYKQLPSPVETTLVGTVTATIANGTNQLDVSYVVNITGIPEGITVYEIVVSGLGKPGLGGEKPTIPQYNQSIALGTNPTTTATAFNTSGTFAITGTDFAVLSKVIPSIANVDSLLGNIYVTVYTTTPETKAPVTNTANAVVPAQAAFTINTISFLNYVPTSSTTGTPATTTAASTTTGATTGSASSVSVSAIALVASVAVAMLL